MKYILMCGSNHEKINGVPRQLVQINGERILDRTIRLLRENNVEDIYITATDPAFRYCGVPVIPYNSKGPWINCFYPQDDPATYIMEDVYFSPEAIKTIVGTDTDCIEFFASAPPFGVQYIKPWAEPFAFKVVNQQCFKYCIDRVRELLAAGEWRRDPIAWELWQVIKRTPINHIDYTNYTVINDYTCDIDTAEDISRLAVII